MNMIISNTAYYKIVKNNHIVNEKFKNSQMSSSLLRVVTDSLGEVQQHLQVT